MSSVSIIGSALSALEASLKSSWTLTVRLSHLFELTDT